MEKRFIDKATILSGKSNHENGDPGRRRIPSPDEAEYYRPEISSAMNITDPEI